MGKHSSVSMSTLSFVSLNILVLGMSILPAGSSVGDRDVKFTSCMKTCRVRECNGTDYKGQPMHLMLLGWDCEGECQYNCMWHTVALLMNHGQPIPQFFGKWPFARVVGIQEPASVAASILNILVHLAGITILRRRTSAEGPLYWFWHVFSMVCINGWFWSAIFHTRDLPITELLDYFSAFSMVTFFFFSAFVRIYEQVYCSQVIGAAVLIISFFTYHIHYLSFVHFDYSYNMKANIVLGILNASCWLIWSWRNRKTHGHVWKGVVFILLALVSVALEVNDFPPIFNTFDAHALWHFSSVIITPLWYSFLIDDCNYLHEKSTFKLD